MDVKVGDEVRIIKPSAGRYHGGGSPEGGWPGRVTRAARKYATAEYEDSGRTVAIEFDMSTGIERGSVNSTYAARVRTPEEMARQLRQGNARDTLFKAGISVNGNWSRLTLEQWEALAAVAATFPEYDRR